MIDLLLFAEDDAQEKLVGTIIRRVADDAGVQVQIRVRSSLPDPRFAGGFGAVLSDVGRFVREYERRVGGGPDVVTVAVDANCKGINDRRSRIDEKAGALAPLLVHAIADPHVERWFLLDGRAFKKVFGRGCQAPDHKCEKDRYKGLLVDAIREAGVNPLLGGAEYAEALAREIDLDRVAGADVAFGRFIKELRERVISARDRPARTIKAELPEES